MKRPLLSLLGVLIFFAVVSIPAFAIATVDPAFNAVPSRAFGSVNSLKQLVQPDGKVLVWGAPIAANGLAKGQIARLNFDGSVDTSFTYCSCQGLLSVVSVALQSDGKLLISGTGDGSLGQVSRANSDGSPDNSYSRVFSGSTPPSGGGSATIWAVLSDNKALVEHFDSFQGYVTRTLYRLNTDGAIDPNFMSFNVGGGRLVQTSLTAIAVDPVGKIYYGQTTYSAGTPFASIGRRNSDGTADTWEVPSITNGGSTFQTSITGLSTQSDGSLLISGSFDTVNGVTRQKIVRLLSAGNVDLSFLAPSYFSVGDVRSLSTGKIFIAASTALGNFNRLYRLNSDGTIDGAFVMDPAIDGINNRFALDSSDLPVFNGTSSQPLYFYRLDATGAQDLSFNPSTKAFGTVTTMVRQSDGKIVVAGTFSQMNTTARPMIARINADGTTDPTFDPGTGFSSVPSQIVLQSDGKIVAFGSFSTYNGAPVSGLIRINSNGSLDSGFTATVSNVNGVSFQADGKLLIAGSFATVNGDPRPRVARLNTDGTTDLSFNANITSGSVSTALQLGDGNIIVGGSFTGVNGFNRSNFVRLDSSGGLDTAFNPTSPPSISNIYIQTDSKYLYIDGYRGSIGRRSVDGSIDTAFVAPTFSYSSSSDLRIYTIAIQSDGSILVGGLFDSVSSVSRNNLVRLNSNGKLDKLFFQKGVTGAVYASANEPGGTCILGGDFWRIQTTVRASLARITPGAFSNVTAFDYDGDGVSDVSVFRPSENKWYVLRSSDFTVMQQIFAISGDIPVPADYDGDGKTDMAIFRPSTGDWWSLSSLDGGQKFAHWGAAGDIPLPSDFDGDGRADYVVFRPSQSIWYRVSSGTGASSNKPFGLPGDKPVIGDFDGDGKSDLAVYRPSDGNWWWQSSVDNVQRATRWGLSTDIACPADFDGDGKTDFAVYRPSTGVWYIINSSNFSFTIIPFGLAEDKPVPADYDGDGRADIAVFRPSDGIWYLLRSTAGFTGFRFGISTDVPTENAFVQ